MKPPQLYTFLKLFLVLVLFLVASASYSQSELIGTWKIDSIISLDGTNGNISPCVPNSLYSKIEIGTDYILPGKDGCIKSFKGFSIIFKRYTSFKRTEGIYSKKFFDLIYGDKIFGIDEYETNYNPKRSRNTSLKIYKVNFNRIVLEKNNMLFFLERV